MENKDNTKPHSRAIVVAHILATILGLCALAGSIALGLHKDWSWWAIAIFVIVTALAAFLFYGATVPDEEGEEDNEIKKDTMTQIFTPVVGLSATVGVIIVGFFIDWPWWAILILAAAIDLVAFIMIFTIIGNDEKEDKQITATTKTTKKEEGKDEDEDKPTTTKKKKDDDDEEFGWLADTLLKIIAATILVCAAYFTKPSDLEIKDKVEQEISHVYFGGRTPIIRYDIDDMFVLKTVSYCAEDGRRTYSGRAIALFGFVWVP